MKKLMMLMVAAVVLPVVSFADAPANTYVVPAGDSTPTEPYDTWATAANDIRTAADAVATHGLVTIVSGDYSGDAKPMTPKQAVEMQVVDAVDSTAPGTATIRSPLFGFNVANTDPNCHALTVSKGTMKCTADLFSDGTADGGSSYSGNKANFRMHFTGGKTHLDLTGKSFYCGFNDSGDQFRLSDNATMSVKTFLIGMTSTGGNNTEVIVDSGASVVCSASTQIGDKTTGCSLTVSNATYTTPALTVGANDTKARNHRVTVCGSAAKTLYVNNSALTLHNDATLEMNVAEAPLAGYNPLALVYPAGFDCNSNATLQVTGLETLAKRLVEAGQLTFSSYILIQYNGKAIVLEGHALESLKDSVAAVPGFTVSVSSAYITLNWTYPGGARTYVVPEGTPGDVPKDPYLTWATASTNILLAVKRTAANGLVTITNGTYSADDMLVDSRAVNLEVVDYENPTGAGEATIGYTFFYNGVTNPTDDPNVNAVTLSKGTFNCRGSNDGVFVDYRRAGGGWGTVMNARFTVTGENTVLDTLTKPLYIGFSMKGIRATVTDRAQLKTSQIYIGLSNNSGNSGLTVANGGSVAASTASAWAMSVPVAISLSRTVR